MADFRPIRRQDRVWDTAEAVGLLAAGEYGFLAMCEPGGYGYGVPVSYAYVAERGCVYIHCATQGHKLEAIAQNDRVSFCVVGPTKVMPYTTAYESVHLFGRIAPVADEAERWDALLVLRAKYNPELADGPRGFIQKSMPSTVVLRLDIEHISGKAKRAPQVGVTLK